MNVQNAIDYSEREVAAKTGRMKKKYLITIALAVLMTGLLCYGLLWWNGYTSIVTRLESGDGKYTLTVYDRKVDGNRITTDPTVTVKLSGEADKTVVYECANFWGIWWSPDSKAYVTRIYDGTLGDKLYLTSLADGAVTELDEALEAGVKMSLWMNYADFRGLTAEELDQAFKKDLEGTSLNSIPEDIQYDFLAFDEENRILVRFSYQNRESVIRTGYIWYNYETGEMTTTREFAA